MKRRDNAMWYVKQLLPLKYDTTYVEDGLVYVCKWRMWFGVSFAIKRGCIGQVMDGWANAYL